MQNKTQRNIYIKVACSPRLCGTEAFFEAKEAIVDLEEQLEDAMKKGKLIAYCVSDQDSYKPLEMAIANLVDYQNIYSSNRLLLDAALPEEIAEIQKHIPGLNKIFKKRKEKERSRLKKKREASRKNKKANKKTNTQKTSMPQTEDTTASEQTREPEE